MSENDSLSLQTLLGIPASIVTLLMGADWLWNKSAVLTWIAHTVWSGLLAEVKFWHLIAIGLFIAGGQYSWSYFQSDAEPNEGTQPFTKEDIQDIKNRVEKKPEWKNYTEDSILGVVWRWNWDSGLLKGIGTPQAYCPRCDMKLEIENYRHGTMKSSNAITECRHDDCNFQKKWEREKNELQDYVKEEIERRKRNGDYET